MTEKEAARSAARRLAILRHAEEVTGNVAKTCRYYGVSRQLFYVWKRRYEAEGPEGLRDRSCQPKHSPNATRVEVVDGQAHGFQLGERNLSAEGLVHVSAPISRSRHRVDQIRTTPSPGLTLTTTSSMRPSR